MLVYSNIPMFKFDWEMLRLNNSPLRARAGCSKNIIWSSPVAIRDPEFMPQRLPKTFAASYKVDHPEMKNIDYLKGRLLKKVTILKT